MCTECDPTQAVDPHYVRNECSVQPTPPTTFERVSSTKPEACWNCVHPERAHVWRCLACGEAVPWNPNEALPEVHTGHGGAVLYCPVEKGTTHA